MHIVHVVCDVYVVYVVYFVVGVTLCLYLLSFENGCHFFFQIADAIVRKARETLERAIHLLNNREEWRARVVYGDTDRCRALLNYLFITNVLRNVIDKKNSRLKLLYELGI